MGIILNIIQDGSSRSVSVNGANTTIVTNTTVQPTVLKRVTENSKVIEVLRGAPGVQNLYVGDIPPDNPQEGWVWIDTSG